MLKNRDKMAAYWNFQMTYESVNSDIKISPQIWKFSAIISLNILSGPLVSLFWDSILLRLFTGFHRIFFTSFFYLSFSFWLNTFKILSTTSQFFLSIHSAVDVVHCIFNFIHCILQSKNVYVIIFFKWFFPSVIASFSFVHVFGFLNSWVNCPGLLAHRDSLKVILNYLLGKIADLLCGQLLDSYCVPLRVSCFKFYFFKDFLWKYSGRTILVWGVQHSESTFLYIAELITMISPGAFCHHKKLLQFYGLYSLFFTLPPRWSWYFIFLKPCVAVFTSEEKWPLPVLSFDSVERNIPSMGCARNSHIVTVGTLAPHILWRTLKLRCSLWILQSLADSIPLLSLGACLWSILWFLLGLPT